MNSGPEVKSDPRRGLPSLDRLLREVEGTAPGLPVWAAKEAARRVITAEREKLAAEGADGAPCPEGELIVRAAVQARALARPQPGRVVNATGIVLHTNLGRAPLAPGAAQAAAEASSGYSDLELDLETGRRGSRTAAVEAKLRLLSGATGALVVNNNAAAVLLALATLGRGREVVVSRGELVEIGGSFRVPDIMESAGVRLVEVGTTNRTHLRDYEAAIGPATALLLKVHRSNFALRGFVADVGLPELSTLGRQHGLPVLEDLGSGTLVDLTARGLPAEAFASGRLAQGADVVCFSGDKLLGGPQAGLILASQAKWSDAMRRNPLARALRIDKSTLAALDWSLAAHLDGRAESGIPVLRQLLESPESLEIRARSLADKLAPQFELAVEADRTYAGGGSLPDFELPTWVVRLTVPGSADRFAARLRAADPPVVARIRDGCILLDVRTLLDADEPDLERALADAAR